MSAGSVSLDLWTLCYRGVITVWVREDMRITATSPQLHMPHPILVSPDWLPCVRTFNHIVSGVA